MTRHVLYLPIPIPDNNIWLQKSTVSLCNARNITRRLWYVLMTLQFSWGLYNLTRWRSLRDCVLCRFFQLQRWCEDRDTTTDKTPDPLFWVSLLYVILGHLLGVCYCTLFYYAKSLNTLVYNAVSQNNLIISNNDLYYLSRCFYKQYKFIKLFKITNLKLVGNFWCKIIWFFNFSALS